VTEPLQPADQDALPTLTQVARVEGVSVPLIQPAKAPRGGRARWAIALVATLVVVLVAGGLVAFAGAGAPSVGPAYAPADALLYLDIRGDLPGDQPQQLATFMAHFPGFADPSSLPTKLDQALDKLVSKATNGAYTYSGNIEPWFGGQLAVAVGPSDSVVLVASVSDSAGLPTKLDQTSQQLASQLGGSLAIADHGGTSVYTISGATGVSGLAAVSFAISTDAIVVAKDAATVDAALDRKAGKSPNLAGSSGFRDAVGRLDADRVGTFYLDGAAAATLLTSASATSACGSAATLAGLPTSMAGELRLQDGNLVIRDRADLPAASTSPAPAATSDLASHVPAGALVYAETHAFGDLWRTQAAALIQNPCFSSVASQLSTIEGLLGTKIPDAFGWVKDAGVVMTAPGGAPQGGLVATTSDAATGQARLTQVLTLLGLAKGQGGPSITTSSAPYAGTTITSVTVDMGTATGTGATNGMPSSVTLSYAFKDQLFVLGVGDAFVKSVLDTTDATSLASDGRYSAALSAAGGPTDSGVLYADVTGIRGLVEAQLPAAQKAQYSADVQPYLTPFDRLISVRDDSAGSESDTTIIFTK